MDDGLYGVRYRYFECQNIKTFCKIPMQTILGTVSPSGGGGGGLCGPPPTQKICLSPHVSHCFDPKMPIL